MKKRVITVADSDQDYLKYFTSFVHSSEYSNRYIIKTFTSISSLSQYLEEHHADILLIHQDFMPVDEKIKSSSVIIQLLEKSSPNDTADLYSVHKYQPFTSLFQNISELIKHKSNHILSKADRIQSRIVSVFSPAGGVGKTTVALNLSRLLAEHDYRVFYLNLEFLSSASALFSKEEEDRFSRLLYDMYTQEEQKIFQLERIIRFDPRFKFYHFPPLHNPAEILDMTEAVVEKLFVSLGQLGQFDYIIIDLDTSQLSCLPYILKRSELVLWVCLEDGYFQHKNRLWLELNQKKDRFFYQALLTKTYYVLNKFLGHGSYGEGQTKLSYDFYLPYIPEWKHSRSIQSLFHSTIFMRELYSIYAFLHQQDMENRLTSTSSSNLSLQH